MSSRILVVDDHPVNRRLLEVILQRDDHQVTAVGDGQEALDALARTVYDLVLMDLVMPVMDGFAALERIRADVALKGLPVIAVTAQTAPEIQDKVAAAGFDNLLLKPVTRAELSEVLAIHLERPSSPPPAS